MKSAARYLLALLVVATCGTKDPPPVEGQDSIRVDTVDVIVTSPVVAVRILPSPARIGVGDTVTFRAWGITAAGDSVPVAGTWITTRPDIIMLLDGVDSDTVRAMGVSPGGRGQITIDPATVIRTDIVALGIGALPVGMLASTAWSDLTWSGFNMDVGEQMRFCAYLYVASGAIAYKSRPECPSPPGAEWGYLETRRLFDPVTRERLLGILDDLCRKRECPKVWGETVG